MAKKKTPAAAPAPAAYTPKKKSSLSKTQLWIGGAVLFMGVVMFSGSQTNPLTYVSVDNEAALRRVFFSGEVWGVA